MEDYPNPFVDKPIIDYCGNCFKLDRTKDLCEKHKTTLQYNGERRTKVYYRCGACLSEKTKNQS